MSSHRNSLLAELVQLVPIVSFAFPLILSGEVDLKRAGQAFLVSAILTLPVTGFVVARRSLHNPILAGVAAWLWIGAASFNIPVRPMADWIASVQGFGLFLAVLLAGGVATFISPNGYVACRSDDVEWVRRSSLGLLGLTLAALGWAWVFRHDIRVGGGLPFILLNVARRVLGKNAPQSKLRCAQ